MLVVTNIKSVVNSKHCCVKVEPHTAANTAVGFGVKLNFLPYIFTFSAQYNNFSPLGVFTWETGTQ